MKNLPLFILIPLFFGCAVGFDRETARTRLADFGPGIKPQQYDSQTSGFDLKIPMKLAIYMDLETMNSSGNFIKQWDFSNKDEKYLIRYMNQLVKKRAVSEYFFMSRNKISPDNLDEIFTQAEKDGADAVLTIKGIVFADWYFSPIAFLDFTIIGAVWIPASNRDSIVLIQADLWDMKDKKSEFTLWAEGSKRVNEPTFLIKTEDAVNPAREKALRNILIELNSETHPSFDLKWSK